MHIILVGGKNQNQFLIKPILERGHRVTIVHEDRNYCKKLARENQTTVVHGDGTNPIVLEDAGIDYANVIIAMTEIDAHNFVICQIAIEKYKLTKVLAVVNDPNNIEVFKQLGIKNVISITNVISSFIEQKVEIDDITNLYTVDEEKIISLELEVVEQSPGAGKKVGELNIPSEAIITCIIREEDVIIPSYETIIKNKDRLITYCHPKFKKSFVKSILGHSN
jgi:trk system potassium uptake protein